MKTKTIEVKRYLTFKRIFGNINLSASNYMITSVFIDDEYISYDLVRENNEVSITIIMKQRCIEEIVITMEEEDELLVQNFERVWSE